MKLKHKRSFNWFDIALYLFTFLMIAICLLPFLNVLAESFSADDAVLSGAVGFVPVGFNVNTYAYLLGDLRFLKSLLVSVFITVCGTVLSLFLAVITAYPLTIKNLRGRGFFMGLLVFTMLFQAGIVPRYIMMKQLKLIDTVFVLFVPGLLNVFNLFIMRNFLAELPAELSEAARIDGANNISVLFKVLLPLCKPVLATLALFYMVAFWNDFFTAIIFITSPDKKPLQLFMYEIVNAALSVESKLGSMSAEEAHFASDTVRSASVMLATFPILCVYPFLQKHFAGGLVMGAVKG